ncbi:hypothetical protein D3C87_1895590 [compost metagenome]
MVALKSDNGARIALVNDVVCALAQHTPILRACWRRQEYPECVADRHRLDHAYHDQNHAITTKDSGGVVIG